MAGKINSGEKNNYLLIKNSSWETSARIIFNKNNVEAEAVARKFRQGLRKIMKDGTYLKIWEKYHGKVNASDAYLRRLDRYLKRAESLNR